MVDLTEQQKQVYMALSIGIYVVIGVITRTSEADP
jgi:hypothetical protein